MLADTALEQSNAEAAQAALAPLTAQPPVSARVCALAARLAQLEGEEAGARRWMARAAHAPEEADWSDIDEAGRAFDFTDADWRRMVESWGRDAQLIHPRHERYEIPAAAAPESVLIEGPAKSSASKIAAGGDDKPGAAFYEPERAPDDPGVDEDGGTR